MSAIRFVNIILLLVVCAAVFGSAIPAGTKSKSKDKSKSKPKFLAAIGSLFHKNKKTAKVHTNGGRNNGLRPLIVWLYKDEQPNKNAEMWLARYLEDTFRGSVSERIGQIYDGKSLHDSEDRDIEPLVKTWQTLLSLAYEFTLTEDKARLRKRCDIKVVDHIFRSIMDLYDMEPNIQRTIEHGVPLFHNAPRINDESLREYYSHASSYLIARFGICLEYITESIAQINKSFFEQTMHSLDLMFERDNKIVRKNGAKDLESIYKVVREQHDFPDSKIIKSLGMLRWPDQIVQFGWNPQQIVDNYLYQSCQDLLANARFVPMYTLMVATIPNRINEADFQDITFKRILEYSRLCHNYMSDKQTVEGGMNYPDNPRFALE